MSTQPEALRIAEALEAFEWNNYDAAAEIRRLYQSEREAWRHADELEQERKRLHDANTELLEALKELLDREWQDDEGDFRLEMARNHARAAIANAQGETK